VWLDDPALRAVDRPFKIVKVLGDEKYKIQHTVTEQEKDNVPCTHLKRRL
jgi:hypothetical protein